MRLRAISILFLWALTTTTSMAQVQHGDVVLQTGFEDAGALTLWNPDHNANVHLAPGYQSAQALVVEQPVAAGAGGVMVRLAVPLGKLRGARVRCEVMAKADGVAKPPQPWSGVKFMLHTAGPGGMQWPQQNDVYGTFDWKLLRFIATVPKDATEAWVMLGLEATTGRVQFDAIKISIETPPRPSRPVGAHPVYTGHGALRLRGAMIGTGGDAAQMEQNLRVLGHAWNANVVRWQLNWPNPADKPQDATAYAAALEKSLADLDHLLPVCQQVGLMVVVDLHTPPSKLFETKEGQDQFLAAWNKMARRYRDQPAIWGYDLLNEPHEGIVPDGLMDWHALATKAAQNIRALDARHAIIMEPMDGAPNELEFFEPLPVTGVVYSVHMYLPHTFTHQGVLTGKPVGVNYPGTIDGLVWDKERLRRALQPVVEWQRDYGMHIYIGEFSAIRWAPNGSGARYLSDLIDIFEENGWDWTYHAFREWSGWSVEYNSDAADNNPSPTPTDREKLLRLWFAKNLKPH